MLIVELLFLTLCTFFLLLPSQEYLKTKIAEHFAGKGEEATIKYLDPSYMIRCDAVSC